MSIKVPQWLMDSSHWARSLSARRHILRQARDNRRKLIAGALLAPFICAP
ncbi:MAG: hypothetical protein R3C68_05750 [Myxococcota bacterium]